MKKSLSLRALLLVLALVLTMIPMFAIGASAEDSGTWTLVTDASTLAAGDKVVIVASGSAFAMSTTQNGNNRGQASVTKSGNTVTFGNDVQVLTLEAGKTSGTFAFNTGSGYLYAASSSKNYLRTETTLSANSSWNITITSAGVATITATGANTRNLLRYNSSSSLFAAYASGQQDVGIYKLVEASGGDACEHTNTTTTTIDATCTEAGSITVTCDSCGEVVSTDEIAALGHSYTNGKCSVCGEIQSADPTWVLVTDATELKAGDKIVIISGEFVAGNISSTFLASVSGVTVSDNTITTLPSGAIILTLGGSEGAWTLSNESGQLLGATDAKKLAWGNGTTTWSISIANDVATIQNGTSTYGRMLYNVNSPRFTTYTSNTSSSMLLPQIYKYVNACEHTNTTTTTIDATCTEAGSTTITCNDCDEVISTTPIPATGHNFVAGTPVAPTCKTEGYTPYTCSCGATENRDVTPIVDHNYENGKCTMCGEDEPECVHTYDDGVVTTDPTCTTTGVKTYTCSKCGETKTEDIPTVDHDYEAVVTDPTCTVAGYTTYTCKNCSDSYTGAPVEATGHNYTGAVTTEPTCTTTGVKTYTCSECGDSYTEVIDAAHKYVDGKCSVCGAIESKTATVVIKDYAESNSWANGTKYEEITADDIITITVTGGGNTGKYYESGYNWRIYQTEDGTITITANSGAIIKKITVTYEIANTGVLTSGGVNVSSDETVEVNASFITFGVGNTGTATNGQVRITAISIEYEPSSCNHVAGAEATCTEAQICTLCGIVLSEALGHNEIEHEAKDPTCTEAGHSAYVTCSRCDYTTYEEIAPIAHSYTEEVTKEANCQETGVKTYTCSVCGDSYTEEIPVTGRHTYDENDFTVTKDPTCTENGKKTSVCTVCGTKGTLTIPMIDHNFVDGKCDMCGLIASETLDFSGEYYFAAIRSALAEKTYRLITGILTDASTVRYSLVDSGFEEVPSGIFKSAANDDYTFVVTKCDDGTYLIYVKSKDTGSIDDVKYLGWDSAMGNSGVLVTEEEALHLTITLTSNGLYEITFVDPDGQTRYLALNSTVNNAYAAWYKEGSNQIQQLHFIPFVDEAIIKGAQLNVGTDLTLKYHVALADGADISNYLMRFTMNDRVVEVSDYVVVDGVYVFSFTGIAPQCMGDNILAELVHKETDKVAASKDNYSVKTYADRILAKHSDNETLAQLIRDILAYGNEAQEYRGYKNEKDSLVGVTGSSERVPTDADMNRSLTTADGKTTDDVRFTAAGVRFDYVNNIYVKVATTNVNNVKVVVNNVTELTLSETDVEGVYIAYSDGISALNFDEVVTFTVYYNDELIQTLTYTVNSYVCDKYENAEIGKLVLALYNYGKSAVAYKEAN